MTCTNCGTHKRGECNCDEILIVSLDNGERVEFVKMTYAEMEKLQRMELDSGEMHCYPLEAIGLSTAEQVKGKLS